MPRDVLLSGRPIYLLVTPETSPCGPIRVVTRGKKGKGRSQRSSARDGAEAVLPTRRGKGRPAGCSGER